MPQPNSPPVASALLGYASPIFSTDFCSHSAALRLAAQLERESFGRLAIRQIPGESGGAVFRGCLVADAADADGPGLFLDANRGDLREQLVDELLRVSLIYRSLAQQIAAPGKGGSRA